jgi:hypothetical protein
MGLALAIRDLKYPLEKFRYFALDALRISIGEDWPDDTGLGPCKKSPNEPQVRPLLSFLSFFDQRVDLNENRSFPRA